MELTVARIGEETRNGNSIVKLQSKAVKETLLGSVSRSSTYYIAIKIDTLKVAVDETVDLDVDNDFTITERPYILEDGSLPKDDDGNDISDDDGNPLMLKWLSVK
jgi:hypothetical protein